MTASTKNVSELSANPYVTSVGGTQFVPTYDANGNDVGNVPESAWNNGAGATGGGQSTLFAKPSYQNVVTPGDGVRDLPDVAMAASNATPGFFWVTDRSGVPEQTCCIGGTSISTPMWAAVSKLIAEIAGPPYRLGAMNPRIYQLGGLGNALSSGLRDVVMGNNSFNGVAGFTAAPGYDLASGWGSPDVQTFESAYLFATIPPTPSPAPTPSPNITFVGAGPLTDSTTALTTVTVALPSGVEAGDTMIAQIVVYDGTASDVPTRPSGWSSIRNDAVNGGNEATSWLYYKVAGANEPASYSWNISSNFAVAVMGAWRGTTLVPDRKFLRRNGGRQQSDHGLRSLTDSQPQSRVGGIFLRVPGSHCSNSDTVGSAKSALQPQFTKGRLCPRFRRPARALCQQRIADLSRNRQHRQHRGHRRHCGFGGDNGSSDAAGTRSDSDPDQYRNRERHRICHQHTDACSNSDAHCNRNGYRDSDGQRYRDCHHDSHNNRNPNCDCHPNAGSDRRQNRRPRVGQRGVGGYRRTNRQELQHQEFRKGKSHRKRRGADRPALASLGLHCQPTLIQYRARTIRP